MPDPRHDVPRHDEQLLEKTKMSFSEHLEELRRALFKSIAALLVGALFGLMIGGSVVDHIQTPLREALEKFYRGQASDENLERLKEVEKEGLPVPSDLEATAKAQADEGLVPKVFLIDPNEWARALGQEVPNTIPSSRDDLIRLRVYQPLEDDPRLNLISLAGHEPFMVYLKASLVVGVILASPLIFFFIWDFVAAGLYGNERKYVYVFLPISLGLFFSGAALAFFVVFEYVLDFLFWFNEAMGINPTPRISEWMSFVLMLPLGFGISFQLPLVMLFLERIGIFTVDVYLSKWRIAILVISIISMFLTPSDPGSMLLMGVPLVALYFVGIAMCRYMPRGKNRFTRDAEMT
ncbi:MAG: twin-arginine translocase subunit TatC [Planctomycetes bacterium]|nr:twin-arginine translocase subunit TatC [Planctomycetota bacterium]